MNPFSLVTCLLGPTPQLTAVLLWRAQWSRVRKEAHRDSKGSPPSPYLTTYSLSLLVHSHVSHYGNRGSRKGQTKSWIGNLTQSLDIEVPLLTWHLLSSLLSNCGFPNKVLSPLLLNPPTFGISVIISTKFHKKYSINALSPLWLAPQFFPQWLILTIILTL